MMGLHFIDEWRVVLKHAAVNWVTAVVDGLVGIVGVHWAVLLGILPFVPLHFQLPLGLLIGVVVIGGPKIVARLSRQDKLNRKIEEKRNANP